MEEFEVADHSFLPAGLLLAPAGREEVEAQTDSHPVPAPWIGAEEPDVELRLPTPTVVIRVDETIPAVVEAVSMKQLRSRLARAIARLHDPARGALVVHGQEQRLDLGSEGAGRFDWREMSKRVEIGGGKS